jgi:hypothetical protein
VRAAPSGAGAAPRRRQRAAPQRHRHGPLWAGLARAGGHRRRCGGAVRPQQAAGAGQEPGQDGEVVPGRSQGARRRRAALTRSSGVRAGRGKRNARASVRWARQPWPALWRHRSMLLAAARQRSVRAACVPSSATAFAIAWLFGRARRRPTLARSARAACAAPAARCPAAGAPARIRARHSAYSRATRHRPRALSACCAGADATLDGCCVLCPACVLLRRRAPTTFIRARRSLSRS